MKQVNYSDVIVVGGGMVGAATAIGLAKQNYSVTLIEKHDLTAFDKNQLPDLRLSAFNMHSVELLKSLGAWTHIKTMRSREYTRLEVSEGQSAQTSFDASSINVEQIGYFVENRLVQLALFIEIKKNYNEQISCVIGEEIAAINTQTGEVALKSGDQLKADIIIGADGAQSQVRNAACIGTSGWQYGQQANAIIIKTRDPVPATTWQVFHPSGPRALLPMYDNYACLVWYDNAQQSKWIQDAEHHVLAQAIKENFPATLPEFEIVKLAGFGLNRMHAHQYGKGKAIILGDAAHTINPLAGQGVNLGFKDVAALLSIIQDQGLDKPDCLISAFEKQRRIPNLLMMSGMDVLYTAFSTPILPVKAIRQIGLLLSEKTGPIKNKVLKYAMGI